MRIVEPPFDRFLNFSELTQLLEGWAAAHPGLMELAEIGRSHGDRPVWLATLTNRATGPALDKPAVWVDANVHSAEVAGSVAAIHLIHRLLTGFGYDSRVTHALDTRCFYVVPRLSPDGVEWYLGTPSRRVRSSTRPYPRDDEQDGLEPEDIDGDGRVLTMRVLDPNGTWKVYGPEPRLLVPRLPEEDEPGPYFRLFNEGRIRNYDGVTITRAPNRFGLDLNRNYPYDWRTEADQKGAGPYPASEPEVRAAVAAIVERPNICAMAMLHTHSGVHLRPYCTKSDDAFPTFDRQVYEAVGAHATELTGYPAVSIFDGFRHDRHEVTTGTAVDWCYDHLGAHAWVTELWNPQRAAGISDAPYPDWGISHPVEDDLKLLAWSDRELDGRAFVDWYPFEHPQLGPLELGGWNVAAFWSNPPPHLLEAEVAPHSEFTLHLALISPRLVMRDLTATALGSGLWRVRLIVENTGWLPTNVTQRALDRKLVQAVEATISLAPDVDAEVLDGTRQELGQLAGRFGKNSMLGLLGATSDSTADRAKADWTVRAPAGTVVNVSARHPRAGAVGGQITLDETPGADGARASHPIRDRDDLR